MNIQKIRNIHNHKPRIFKAHFPIHIMNIIRKKRTHRNEITNQKSKNSRKNRLIFELLIALNPYYDCHEGHSNDVTNVSQTCHKYVTNQSQMCHKPVTNTSQIVTKNGLKVPNL